MRIFHMTVLGETTKAMGKADPLADPKSAVRFGLYACSPGASTFVARFNQLSYTECMWKPHPQ